MKLSVNNCARHPERRNNPCRVAKVRAIYESELLKFEGSVVDLSLGRLFIASAVFDKVGTECHLRLAINSVAIVKVTGIVSRVVNPFVHKRKSTGMSIRVTKIIGSLDAWFNLVSGYPIGIPFVEVK